jgi:hypothetical protein
MSDELHIVVTRDRPAGVSDEEEWMRADVILNGRVVATGFAPDYGVYHKEGNSRSSAISLAQGTFMREQLRDIRDRTNE